MFVTECLGVYSSTGPDGGQAPDWPWVAGRYVMVLSLYDVQYDIQNTKKLTDSLIITEGLASALNTGSIQHQMEGHCAVSQVGRL